jgi:hypothetical protein
VALQSWKGRRWLFNPGKGGGVFWKGRRRGILEREEEEREEEEREEEEREEVALQSWKGRRRGGGWWWWILNPGKGGGGSWKVRRWLFNPGKGGGVSSILEREEGYIQS